MIQLYHGSNIEINRIDLSLCRPGKDFGKGFYLNPNYSQAFDMARKTTRIMRSGSEIVSAFDFDDIYAREQPDIKIKIFDGYSYRMG